MTNHAFASSKCNLTTEKLHLDINSIIERRFYNELETELRGDYVCVSFRNKEIYEYEVLSLHLCSVKKVEMRAGAYFISRWIQSVIQNELAFQYKGKCSDEGVSEKWEPQIRFFTYKEWYNYMYRNRPKAFWIIEKKYLNKMNKKLIG
jgi:hypothetical protein